MTIALAVNSCKQKDILIPEQPKDISGEWRITKALRNNIDITALTDFSQFRIRFTADMKYSIENPLPFVVSKSGNYSMDDPKYPFRITFNQAGGTAVSSGFTYPVVNGKRNMNFTFSPGCPSNIYLYTLERVNP